MHIFNKAFRVLKKKKETQTKERPVVVLMRHVIVKALRTRSGSRDTPQSCHAHTRPWV